MENQFRNIDLRGPSKVRIIWRMETPRDDSTSADFYDDPTHVDEGFFPSLDVDDAGYIGPNPTRSYQEQMDAANARYQAFCNDDWEYVGVIAEAQVYIPIGGSSYTIHTFKSAGVWGVESDSREYLAELYKEQKAELLAQLEALGTALASGDYIDQTDGKSAVPA